MTGAAEYKPHISQIRIHRLKGWIEARLTELLDGLEDEILWGMVFNLLEDAQRRATKEGPEVNPTGGLERKAVSDALHGFLGQAKAAQFVDELFGKLQEAEMTDEAFEIISSARKPERTLAERVEREVRRSRGRDSSSGRERDRSRERFDRSHERFDRSCERRDRSHSRGRERSDRSDSRDRYYRQSSRSRDQYSRDRSRSRDRYYSARDGSRERHSHGSRERHRLHEHSGYHSRPSRDRSSGRYDSVDDSYRRHRSQRSRSRSRSHLQPNRILSSSSSSSSESPTQRRDEADRSWERETVEVPKAPNVSETVSSALEAALRERALKSKKVV